MDYGLTAEARLYLVVQRTRTFFQENPDYEPIGFGPEAVVGILHPTLQGAAAVLALLATQGYLRQISVPGVFTPRYLPTAKEYPL